MCKQTGNSRKAGQEADQEKIEHPGEASWNTAIVHQHPGNPGEKPEPCHRPSDKASQEGLFFGGGSSDKPDKRDKGNPGEIALAHNGETTEPQETSKPRQQQEMMRSCGHRATSIRFNEARESIFLKLELH